MILDGEIRNRECSLSSRILGLRETLRALRKQARKTPPRTLVLEWAKVHRARTDAERVVGELHTAMQRHLALRLYLGLGRPWNGPNASYEGLDVTQPLLPQLQGDHA